MATWFLAINVSFGLWAVEHTLRQIRNELKRLNDGKR
jgi:hypothetical protein